MRYVILTVVVNYVEQLSVDILMMFCGRPASGIEQVVSSQH